MTEKTLIEKAKDVLSPATPYEKSINNIERKEQLQADLETARRKESRARNDAQRLLSRIQDKQNYVRGTKAAFERSNNADDGRKLEGLLKEKSNLESQREAELLSVCSALEEQETLSGELLSLRIGANDKVLLDHQAKIAGIEAQINRLTGLITEQQTIIVAHDFSENRAEELRQQRQEILTDISLGDDKAEELQAITKELAAAEKVDAKTNTANAQATQDAQAIVAGLSGRLSVEQTKLTLLKRNTPHLFGEYIRDMALIELEAYKKASNNIIGIVERINHLDSLMEVHGDEATTGVLNFDRWEMKLPRFKDMVSLSSTQDSEHYYVDFNNHTVFDPAGAEAIKSAVIKKGIILG